MFDSILDDDLYKFTMQQAVLKLYPSAVAEYKFINRGPQRFSLDFIRRLRVEIERMEYLLLTPREKQYLKKKLPFLSPWYIDYLSTYKYDSSQVKTKLTTDNNLEISIKGLWHEVILWEVKLMALISELYFEDKDDSEYEFDKIVKNIETKALRLEEAGCLFADFGTRRRRSFYVQEHVDSICSKFPNFVGTSNVLLAYKFGLKPIGTMAHEWVQGISALESFNHPNRFMLQKWAEVYEGSLGIALTDTFGSDSFFRDFSTRYSKLFDGIRHDSADPFVLTDKAIKHYTSKNIDPSSKRIVFSDSLNVDKAIKINEYAKQKGIGASFGIGTHLTNDFEIPALNIVIKLVSLDGFPVVKISDEPGKEVGEKEWIGIMKKIHRRT